MFDKSWKDQNMSCTLCNDWILLLIEYNLILDIASFHKVDFQLPAETSTKQNYYVFTNGLKCNVLHDYIFFVSCSISA